jgi:hypothetical protein
MTFNIPHDYERKWDSCFVENGVMCIKFRRDTDDSEKASSLPVASLMGGRGL